MTLNFKHNRNPHLKSRKTSSVKTSWGNVSLWYDKLLSSAGTYQKELILPNLLRLINIKKGDNLLDLACGQGFFSNHFSEKGAIVTGVDISPELIDIAKKHNPKNINFIVSPADNLSIIKNSPFDKVVIVLAIQNISNLSGVVSEVSRVLKTGGAFYIVLNHPAYRIPQKSDWGFDSKKNIQYRKVEKYLSEIMLKIDMNPGEKNIKNKKYTVSIHRPLQSYFSIFNKFGFVVSRLEEWISHKKSEVGPRQKAEDVARKEIPMFMFIEAIKK